MDTPEKNPSIDGLSTELVADRSGSKFKCQVEKREPKQKLFTFRWLLRKSKSSRSSKDMAQAEKNPIVNIPSSKSCDTGLTTLGNVERCSTFLLWKLLPPAGKSSVPKPQTDCRQKLPFRASFSCNDVHTLVPSGVGSAQDLNKCSKSALKQPTPSWYMSSNIFFDKHECPDKFPMLLKFRNEKRILCKLCLAMVPESSMHSLHDCHCTFCKMCLHQYLTINIREGKVPITCPDADCVSSGEFKLQEILEIAGEDACMMFQRYKLNIEVDMDTERCWCPAPGCETVCSVAPSTNHDRPGPVICHRCKMKFCSLCKIRWHDQITCEEARKSIGKEIEPSASGGSWEEEGGIKRCPHCRVPIEKDEGCAQMMCYRCKHVFCWHCLASLDDDFLLRHYDKGPCRNKLGHSRASMIWHRTQVVGIFAGFSFLLLIASPVLLLAAPCLLCCRCHRLDLAFDQETASHL